MVGIYFFGIRLNSHVWNGPTPIDTVEGNAVGRVDAIAVLQARNFGTPSLGDLNAIVMLFGLYTRYLDF
jgi:hypothetical protein